MVIDIKNPKNKSIQDDFIELKESPKYGGSLLTKVNLSPAQAFELIESIYGPYEDLLKEFTFIDDKTSWERYFKTSNGGVLRVYDFKGSVSIGSGSEENQSLETNAEKFKSLLEAAWMPYAKAKRRWLKREIRKYPISNFMRTFAATSKLLERAYESGSYLEALVLYASVTEAQLRYGIILLEQLRDKTSQYDKEIVFQANDKSYIRERSIFQRASTMKLISANTFEEISRLYSLRNRAVHRYFISDFEYGELPKILDRYRKVKTILGRKLLMLERRQVRRKIGMMSPEQLEINHETEKRILVEGQLKLDSNEPLAVVPKRKYLFSREHGPPKNTEELENRNPLKPKDERGRNT